MYNIYKGKDLIEEKDQSPEGPNVASGKESLPLDSLTVEQSAAASREVLLKTGKTLTDQLKEDISDVAEVSALQIPGLEGKEVIKIRVTDKEKWQSEENLRKLVRPFGEVIFDSYRDRDDPAVFRDDDPELLEEFFQENIVEADLSLSDTVYAVAEQGRVIGFISLSDFQLEDGTHVDELMLTGVIRDREKTALGRQLYEFMLHNIQSDALISVSHTPSAVKNGIKLGKSNGWQVYYGGLREGDPDIPMTDAEVRMLGKAEEGIRAKIAKYPDVGHFQEGIPPHYVSYGNLGIPPRRLEELKFKQGDPLKGTFEELIQWQMRNRPGHTIYGILVSLRGSALS